VNSIVATTAINLTGNETGQTLQGNNGANTLRGGGGADTMVGHDGNDTYFVDNASDRVIEAAGEGDDRVYSSASYSLGTGQSVEYLSVNSIVATTAISLAGNALGQTLQGNNGANALDGRGGADTMIGHDGDDRYYVDSSGDRVIEAAGGGNDTVYASVSYSLGTGPEVELLRTNASTATTAINLAGNEFGQTLQGNSGANALNGHGGNDVLYGYGGNDTFVFTDALNASSNVDTIADFSVADDRIWLDDAIFQALSTGALSSAEFRTGAAASDGNDRIVYNDANGWLSYDADGNGAQAQIHFATLDAHLALAAGDFYVG
jgi:Ca2+-binding RTX toxin-like protein